MRQETAELAILIPERGRPELLARTLDALSMAREALPETSVVHVLVNGERFEGYAALRARFGDVHWHHHREALGYHGAIRALLDLTAAPWVYLLNSDMVLAPDALAQVMPWRAPDVFAVASQIVPADRTRRREETGWTVPVRDAKGRLELHDLEPPDESVRGHVYAGGGASLFQRSPLRRYVETSRAYAPFYFEDADWGVKAWADGFLVLHCPRSVGVHEQHATIGHYLSRSFVNAIVARNLGIFRYRYGDVFGARRAAFLRSPCALPTWLRHLSEHRRSRAQALASPLPRMGTTLHLKRFPHPCRHRAGKPCVLLVSPFAILPPAHGGARRIVELARASHEDIDWVLLHDEAGPQAAEADALDACFREIHPVHGRPDSGGDVDSRWRDHAHAWMQCALARLIDTVRPDAICFEHIECIGLIEALRTPIPCLWTLHDAGRDLPVSARARVQAAIDRVQALILTTPADVGQWSHACQQVIENGVRLEPLPVAARQVERLLMVAPLRYEPNRSGLFRFLDVAWPALRKAHPHIRLRVLGGPGAKGFLPQQRLPLPDGVELIDGYVEPAPHYAECTLALNPQTDIEGSAIKIAEALAHARVIVSTQAGARGYEQLDSPALKRVASVDAMVPAVSSLLHDAGHRMHGESRARDDIAPWDWQGRARQLTALLARCIGAAHER